MAKVELNLDQLDMVAGGSYQLNHNSGKCVIGNNSSGFQYWQLDASCCDAIQAQFDAIMDGPGTDTEKNAKMVSLIEANGWGTRVR